ncbi:MAG TPA: hypothetical protein VM618_02590, partial [Acidimicrobiia bacterium]|nr:hypothetical protein [Acidimicrobiia bacterium]
GISITLGSDSKSASFSSPIENVAGFSVKGGMPEDSDDVRNTEYYDPLEDADTVASTINRGGNLSTVSNVCITLGTPPTTTTTVEETTTTTIGEEEVTTTTADVEGLVETTTTTAAVKGIVVESETPRAAPETLAFTGGGDRTAFLVGTGLVLMALGATMQVLIRRRIVS